MNRLALSLVFFAFLTCSSVTTPVFAEFELTFQSGQVALFGSSNLNGNSPEPTRAEFPVNPNTSNNTGGGATTTGGVLGDPMATGMAMYRAMINQTMSEGTPRTILSFEASSSSSFMNLGAGDEASVNIQAATSDLAFPPVAGFPIVVRLTSDSGPVPFNVLQAPTILGNGFFRITPEPLGGMLEPGDYMLEFDVSSGLFCGSNDPSCAMEATSSIHYAIELFVPEPSAALLALLSMTALSMTGRMRCLG